MRTYSTILLLIINTALLGQSTNITTLFHNNYRKAEQYYDQMYYTNALDLYKRVLEKNPGHYDSKVKIAHCYRILNDTKNAENWYGVVAVDERAEPLVKYYYAQALASNGKYDQARTWYQYFQQVSPNDSRPLKKFDVLDNIPFYFRDTALYDIQNLRRLNSDKSDFGPIRFDQGLVFLSARDEDLFIKHNSPIDHGSMIQMYYSRISESGNYSIPEKFHSELNSKYNEGPATFNSDHKEIIFTRNNFVHGSTARSTDRRINLKLLTSKLDAGGDWSKVTSLNINNDEFSTAHPSLTIDGKYLYFSSDRPGGFGGSDIYVSEKLGNSWSEPINLGPEINTEGDEMFPYISGGDVLYFSSDGHGGLGGLDNFMAFKTRKGFTNVHNMGFPLNTNYDDFGITTDQGNRTGFFTSNRPGGRGNDDVYSFTFNYLMVVGTLRQQKDNGLIPDAEIELYNLDGHLINKTISDIQGKFYFDVCLEGDYTIVAKKLGYTMDEAFTLSTLQIPTPVDSINIYLWKHRLFAKGKVYSNEEEIVMSDVEIKIHNLTDNTIDTLITGEEGEYLFVLQSDKNYKIAASKEDYLPEELEINTINIEEGEILNDFVLEEEYIDKSVIFFDYNKSNIRSDSDYELRRILKILQRHPEEIIVISAHADSRGSVNYNQRLSDRRANEAKKYFVRNGIKEDRIIARGFGEGLLINRCSNGIDCHEVEHSKNRRAELKVEKPTQ